MALGVSFGTLISLLVLLLVCVPSIDASTLGQPCNSMNVCTGDHVVCSTLNNICVCNNGYQQSSSGNACAVSLGSQCLNGSSDTCLDSNALCTEVSTGSTNYTCQCIGLYYNSGNSCAQKISLDKPCPDPTTTGVLASQSCSDLEATCTYTGSGYKCQCNDDYFDNNGTCTKKISLDNPCPDPTMTGVLASQSCSDLKATCKDTGSGYKCQCSDGYYDNNGACAPKISLDNPCPDPTKTGESCSDLKATCKDTGSGYKCQCSDDYYNHMGACAQKKSLGHTCLMSLNVTQCKDPNAECRNDSPTAICQCKTGFYDSNGGGTLDGMCEAKIPPSGLCPSSLPTGVAASDPCSDPKAVCKADGSNYKCLCIDDYYNNNGTCTQKVGLGSACPKPDACSTTNAVCSNSSGGGTCICGSDYYDSNGNTSGGNCSIKVGLGTTCPQPDACGTSSSVCSNISGGGICVCGNTFYDSNGRILGGNCTAKTALGQNCPQPDACEPQNSECGSRNICVCSAGYYASYGANNAGSCTAKVGLGSSCPQQDACSENNSICNQYNSTCVCNAGFYDSNGPDPNGSCVSKVGLGRACPRPDACGTPNSTCSSSTGEGTCVCSSNYFDDNGENMDGKCQLKVQLGSNCPMPTACATQYSICQGTTCQCSSGYYDDNGTSSGGSCRSRLPLNTNCESTPLNNFNQRDQCLDENADCSYNSPSTCTCNVGYHIEGTSCVANKPLGDSCVYRTECSDANADCLSSKCTCKESYYDSNGFNKSGNCLPVSNLQVIGIAFSTVTTSSITVSWTLPEARLHINVLEITWTPSSGIGQPVNQIINNAAQVSYTISSQIDSGRAYNIAIISRNTQTQLNSSRESEPVHAYQAAKPAKPLGPLELTDMDASDQVIGFSWPAVPYSSGFDVKLLDGTILLKETSQISNSWQIYNDTLLNGHRYNVTIITKSEMYTSGNNHNTVLYSDIYREQIKTSAKAPGPPKSAQCSTGDSYSILLMWSPPAMPNGDLVQYHIEVYEQSKDTNAVAYYKTGNISTAYTVKMLKPGFYYFFKIMTENELANSSAVNIDFCQTTAGKSGEPVNLTVTEVTSRTMSVSWGHPERTNSQELLGYILQIKDNKSTCVQQRFICQDCIGSQQVPSIFLCANNAHDIPVTKQQLSERQRYTVTGLLPDIEYTVSVSALNPYGQGNVSYLVQRSDEEVPQMPTNISVTDIQEKSMIVVWKLPEPRPGSTNFTVTLTTDSPALPSVTTVEGFDKNNVVMGNLEENWTYGVSVTATTSKGNKTTVSPVKYTTKPAAPGQVEDFTWVTLGTDFTKLQVKWMIPSILNRNSNITGYVFVNNATGTENTEEIQLESEDHIYVKIVSVVPEDYYVFKVYAKNQEGMNGVERILDIQAPAGVPYNQYETESTRVIPSAPAVSKNTVTIVVKRAFLNQTRNGLIRLTGLIGCEHSKCNISGSSMTKPAFETMRTYGQASKEGFIPYRITKNDWETSAGSRRRRRSVTDEIMYTVGTESCNSNSLTYCNGPLPPDTSFSIIVVTCTNGGCLLSELYGPFRTEKEPDELPIGAIIGGVVGGVAALLIICIIGVLMYRRRNQGPSKMTKIVEDSMPNISRNEEANIARKRPVKLSEFEAHLKEMHKDTNLQFSAAYEDLKAISPRHSQNAANEEDNKMKNRYINILPFDHSRVKLSASGEENNEDYINANYLPGYRSPREYIGCQGPLPGTIDDFWRMVWEQNVSVVVMLTLCKEQQKVKCEQYWPNEVNDPKQFGDVVVEVTSYSSIKTYDFRVFKLVCNGRTRILKHFHFLTWLDFQANVQHEIILDFITQVRSHVQPPDTAGPMIIHCSAGVGRTGTYIVLDHLMQYIDDHDFEVNIDIFDMVMKLRENRPHMVQTEQQFVFIHDCVKVLLDKKRIAMAEQNNIYENRAFDNKEDNIYQNQQELTYENVQMKTEL